METKVEGIETKVDSLHVKLDHFIECADTKYAEKARVNEIEKKVNRIDITVAKWGGAIVVLSGLIQLVISKFIG